MDIAEAAKAYLALGYSVLPLLPGDKRPAMEWKELQERYPTDEEVDQWWAKWPAANVGIITGRISDLSVIDVDGEVGMESIRGQPEKPPSTRVIKTPKGWHLYYRYREDWHTGAAFLPGIDVRNDGGYVVAPPSVVDGKEYHVFRDKEIAVMHLPMSAFEQHGRNGTTPLPRDTDRPTWVRDAITNGSDLHTRNQTATRLIGYFHSLGTPRDIIEGILTTYAEKCSPPMDLRELRSTIESVTRYQARVTAARVAEPPQFTDEGDTLVYRWPEHAVTIRLANMDAGKDGVHSEVTIEAAPPGVPPIMYGPSKFNMTSTPARTSLVKYMAERYALDWAGTLEAVCRLAVMEVREGEPIVDLRDHVSRQSKWLLHPFILEDQTTFLFADGGTGKSLFALALALTIQEGAPLVGRVPNLTAVGLYLDWEASAQEHFDRYRDILRGADIDYANVGMLYRRCDTPLVDQVAQLRRYIVEHNVGFVVVDSVVAACNGEAEHSDTARQFFSALRKLKVSSLCVSHTTKQDDTSHKPFGSSFWNNLARNTWQMRKVQEDESDTMSLALYNRKINAGRNHKPIGYTVTFGEDGIRLRTSDVMAVPEFAAQQPIKAQIYSLLRHEGMTAKDIAETLSLKEDSVRVILYRNKGMFIRVGDEWNILEKRDL